MTNTPRKPLKQIVLLYNDRDRAEVLQIRRLMLPTLVAKDLWPWMASEDMSAFGDIFDNIEGAIRNAEGSIIFLGQHGLGRFQDNIERGAVATEVWQKGARYGTLLVHLHGGLSVPPSLLRWSSVNHDGELKDPDAIVQATLQRFGLHEQSTAGSS